MSHHEKMLGQAVRNLDQIKGLATQVGLKFVDLEPTFVGVGIAVLFGDDMYSVMSVMGGGNEDVVMFTSGVLQDIQQVRLAALDTCNQQTRNNPAYPTFLHDAEAGWDILIQSMFPISLMFASPEYFVGCAGNLPTHASQVRAAFSEADLGGRPYRWDIHDVQRLLARSML